MHRRPKLIALENRIANLEQTFTAAVTAHQLKAELVALRELVDRFFEAAAVHDVDIWNAHPDVQEAATQLVNANAKSPTDQKEIST